MHLPLHGDEGKLARVWGAACVRITGVGRIIHLSPSPDPHEVPVALFRGIKIELCRLAVYKHCLAQRSAA